MRKLFGYYCDNQGNFYVLKEVVSTGWIFKEVEWVYGKGFVVTERSRFFSNSDLEEFFN